MLLRREVLGKAAAGAVAAATLSVARTSGATPRAAATGAAHLPGDRAGESAATPPTASEGPVATVTETAPPPWELLHPLTAGATVAPGWRLVDLSPVRGGACVVTLGNDGGRTRRIHLCRNDGEPQGIIHTRRVDLLLMNEGYGELPTEEALARAIAAVAHRVAANEATVSTELLGGLVAHQERERRYAAAAGPAADGQLR